ncbi:tetratricopeptide repeat protein [Corallibacter sp.]|uniref:tetratricopeptide repeat protein n=1 Tax=Corallibacter sp. TaxID=2038084 RepID=UPI003AB8FF2F
MKNTLIVALSLSVTTFSFAQKKELKTAEKAIKNANYAEAKTALGQAKSLMSSMDDKLKDKYNFLNAKALYANGTGSQSDINEALTSLESVSDNYASELSELKTAMENDFLTKANEAYKSNNFSLATDKFEQLYRVVPSDTTYLYYAAVSAVSGQDYDAALNHYLKLSDLGYTGQEKQYYATNVETGEEEVFDKATRDILVKGDDYIKPVDRMTESKLAEITKNIALIYVNLDKNDEAIAAIKKARANEPSDVNLILTEANLQYKMGNTDAYKSLIEEAIELDPNNIDLFYNLGVLSAESGNNEKAKEYYNKVIEMDPTYVNAQTNIAALILDEEKDIIEEMNGLGSSAADNKRYDELKEERMNVYKSAIPYLEAVLKINPDDVQVTKTLMNIYSAIDNTAKFKALKAKLETLEGN